MWHVLFPLPTPILSLSLSLLPHQIKSLPHNPSPYLTLLVSLYTNFTTCNFLIRPSYLSPTPIHSLPFPPKLFSTFCLRASSHLTPTSSLILFSYFYFLFFPSVYKYVSQPPSLPLINSNYCMSLLFLLSLSLSSYIYNLAFNFYIYCLRCWIFLSFSWFITSWLHLYDIYHVCVNWWLLNLFN